MKHIPNILSGLRILMVLAFIFFFIRQEFLVCLILYVSAFLTDVLDGFLARKFNWVSDLGKLLDPFADKFMLLSALVCLFFKLKDIFPIYVVLVAVVIVKEVLMMIGGLIVLRKKKVSVYADIFGKAATGLFFASVTLTLVDLAFGWIIPEWILVVFYIAAIVTSIVSLFHYAYLGGFIGRKYREVNAYELDPADPADPAEDKE